MKEKVLKAKPGMAMLILFIVLYIAAIVLIILGGNLLDHYNTELSIQVRHFV